MQMVEIFLSGIPDERFLAEVRRRGLKIDGGDLLRHIGPMNTSSASPCVPPLNGSRQPLYPSIHTRPCMSADRNSTEIKWLIRPATQAPPGRCGHA
jgi:hypothetical protein